MRVKEVIYVAKDQAALTADYIRLKLTLVKDGVDMDWTTLDGESNTMNQRVWSVAHGGRAGEGIEADEIRVEAFDLEVDSHYLNINGHEIYIPKTGVLNTQTYSFPL